MKRVAIVADLKPGAHEVAKALLAQGPPFELGEEGFDKHAVYVSEKEVVFVFEGEEVEWRLDDLVSDFFHGALQRSLERWRELVDGEPRVAEQAYAWERRAPRDDVGDAQDGP